MSLAWSSKSLKATPVSADQLLIIDSEDAVTSTQNKRILLSAIPDLGEENTASNSGAGNGWVQTKSGVDLPFKSLITTSPISTTVNTNDLTLTLDDLVNSDISSSAAIDFSKLASLTDGNILVGSSLSVVTSVTMSGDATITNTGALTVATNAITDDKIITHTTTKITTSTKSLLNTEIVYNDQANTFGDFNQIFHDDKLFIQNPAKTFEYQIVASAITADRILTLPLLSSNDTIVTAAFSQTLTNKTFSSSNEFEDDALIIQNPLNTFNYTIQASAITADRTATIPLLISSDTFVFENHIQTLTNKTLTSPTLTTPTITSFINANHDHTNAIGGGQLTSTTALTDTTDIAYLNTANSYTAGTLQTFLGDTSGTSGVNVGSIAGDPTTQANGDIWYNSSSGILFGRIGGVNIDLGASASSSPPFSDTNAIVKGNVDATKELRFEVDGNTTGIVGVIATTFSTAKTVTIPDSTTTLAGLSTAQSFTATQTFQDDSIEISNPADTSQYTIQASAITGDRTVTLPILVSSDTFVFEAHTQTLTNKTFDASNEFEDNGLVIQNPLNTANYIIQASAITAARTATIPLLITSDTFVFEDHTQTLTNKTFVSPTFTGDINADNLVLSGDLIVNGTTTSLNTETVNISDNHLYLNSGYTTTTAQTGGLVVNYLPTSTTTTVSSGAFVAGIISSSNPTVDTVGAATFSASDLVQISGSDDNENDGLFEVLTHTSNVLTIRGVGITATDEDFTNNQFIANASDNATITKVTVSVMRSGIDGLWETASGSATGFSFVDNVTLSATQTLTNKTLTTPKISSISNTGTLTLPTSTDTLVGRETTDTFTSKSINLANNTLTGTSSQLATAISDETGTGSLVFATSPTLVTPELGTPSTLVLTSATGLPVSGLANGTDGELITWDSLGVADTVGVGTAGQVLTSAGVGAAPSFQSVAGTGDMVLAAIQTITGAKTFNNETFLLNNPGNSFAYTIVGSTITADRTITLPLITASDTLVVLGLPQSYTAGTLQTFLGDTSGTSGLNVGGIEGNPTTQTDGDVWLNTSSNQVFARINGVDVDLGAGAGGEVVTWTANHSMATFKLTATALNDVILNAPTGQATSLEVNGAEEYSFNSTQADFNGNNLVNVGVLELSNPTNSFQYIISSASITADRILNLPLLGGTDTIVTAAFIQTLTNKTLTAPIFADLGFIADANGNELIIFDTVTSAVNEITLVNAITATPVELQASGGDTNVSVKMVPKGTGQFFGNRETWAWPLTDESTAPSTGVTYTTEPAPYDMSIDDAIIGLTTAGTGATLFSIDVLKETSVNGNAFTTIFSTLPTIDASEFTSTTATTAAVISTTTWEKGRRLQLSISAIDTNALGRGAKIALIVHATAE